MTLYELTAMTYEVWTCETLGSEWQQQLVTPDYRKAYDLFQKSHREELNVIIIRNEKTLDHESITR